MKAAPAILPELFPNCFRIVLGKYFHLGLPPQRHPADLLLMPVQIVLRGLRHRHLSLLAQRHRDY